MSEEEGPSQIKDSEFVEKRSHHLRHDLCKTRAKYREGKKETAVKVYTINDESKCLLLQGVPALGLESEVVNLCSKFGPIEFVQVAKDYPLEKQFAEVYVVKFKYFLNAVYAKKRLDDYCFMDQCLHVCYAPELETIHDTKEKLMERKKMVRKKIQKLNQELVKHKFESNISTEAQRLYAVADQS